MRGRAGAPPETSDASVADGRPVGGAPTRRQPAPRPALVRRWLGSEAARGRAIVLGAVAAATFTLRAAAHHRTSSLMAGMWQLLDIRELEGDPLGSVWHLHTQPPLFNLLVGVVGWSPLPMLGTLYLLDLAALAGVGLLLHTILMRCGLRPVAAGVIAALAVLNPELLTTVRLASYEILLAFLLVAVVAAAQRYLDDPRPARLMAVSALLTVCVLTRSLLHPLWLLAVLGVLLVARPTARRAAIASLALPVLLAGGWVVKNQVVFGTPTLSSWLGFNMHRGVTAMMAPDLVRADVAAGEVSPLALGHPWGELDEYDEWTAGCRPHDHPVTSRETKRPLGRPNFNHECYLPVYRQEQRDAVTLVRRHPAEYAGDRWAALRWSFATSSILAGGRTTWLETAYDPLLLPTTVRISQEDWNLPLLGAVGSIPLEVSLTLAAGAVFIGVRGAVALVRLVRLGWRDRAGWPATEVMWLVVAATVATVIVGGDLVEMGENNRFRTSVDPLLIALPLAWVTLAVQRRRSAPRSIGATARPGPPAGSAG